MPDSSIDKLQVSRLQQNLIVPGTEASSGFVKQMSETPEWRENEPFYRVSDLAVMQIIKDNFGHRPIYFAVTCESFIGFEEYTRNEGMVARLVAVPGDDMVNGPRLLKNIDEIYEYRSIEDESVFKDDNMRRLVMNYGSGFVRAATYLADQGENEKAAAYIERARVFIDEEIKLTDFYTRFYSNAGEWDKLEGFVDNVIFKHPQGWRIYISYVMSYILENHLEVASRFIEKGTLQYPSEEYFLQLIMHYAEKYEQFDDAKAILKRVQSRVRYDVNPYIEELNKMQAGVVSGV